MSQFLELSGEDVTLCVVTDEKKRIKWHQNKVLREWLTYSTFNFVWK